MNLFKNSAVKAIIHMLFFAVLLKLSGMFVTWLWNKYLVKYTDVEPISFLESVGIVAFGYLVFAGIRFGFNQYELAQRHNENLHPGNMPQCRECAKDTDSSTLSKIKNFDRDDKEKLKEAIAKCCGINHNPINGSTHTSPNIPYHNTQLKKNDF